MTVILSQPSHIGLPPLPTQQLDIAFAPDPATPRAVLAHAAIDIVAAAVTLAPSLSPVLPPDAPEYCLASKRKAPDDDAPDLARCTKRSKHDDDALFGPLPTALIDTDPSALPTNADPMQVVIEQAIAAFLSYSAPEPVPVPQDLPPPACQPAQPHAAASRSSNSPLAVPIDSSIFDTSLEPSTPLPSRPRLPSPPRNRVVEPPLWKLACRTRVDHVIGMHGGQAIRATIVQEQWQPRATRSPADSRESQPRRSPPEQLELEIYTPLTFPAASLSPEKEISPTLDMDTDVDMSFDLDSDSESDSESDSGDDDELDTLSVNESILDVSFSEPNADSNGTSTPEEEPTTAFPSLLSPVSLPPPIMLPSLPPVWPPRLPRLSTIPVYCLREYPQMELLGTPSCNLGARGSFRPKNACASTPPVRMSVVL